jgi:hypothetical protein
VKKPIIIDCVMFSDIAMLWFALFPTSVSPSQWSMTEVDLPVRLLVIGYGNDCLTGIAQTKRPFSGPGNDHVQVGAVRLRSANDNTAAFLCRYVR